MWCDQCQPGFYNLQPDNPDGCDRCFCFGLSDECYSSDWGAQQVRDVLKIEQYRSIQYSSILFAEQMPCH